MARGLGYYLMGLNITVPHGYGVGLLLNVSKSHCSSRLGGWVIT